MNALHAAAPDPCLLWDRECGPVAPMPYRPAPPRVNPGERTVEMRLGCSFTVRKGRELLSCKLTNIGGASRDLLCFSIAYTDAAGQVLYGQQVFGAGRIVGFGFGSVLVTLSAVAEGFGIVRVKIQTPGEIIAG